MAVPDYRALMQPTLQALAESGEDTRLGPLTDTLVHRLGLTAEAASERLPSGRDTVLSNRLQWALAYLQSTGMVAETRGAYRPTEAGCEHAAGDLLAQPTIQPLLDPPVTSPAPHEARLDRLLAATFSSLQKRLRHQLLARVHELPPPIFEHLIVDLLHAMGYGWHRRDLVRYLGRCGDGGIDGAVHQDALGLDIVYVQAKRYRPGSLVPASAVRDFAGSLAAVKARKGVFATTASFPKSAERFVGAVPSRIVLIDGQGLADLLVQHNIAVRSRETYDVKEIDESYFAL